MAYVSFIYFVRCVLNFRAVFNEEKEEFEKTMKENKRLAL